MEKMLVSELKDGSIVSSVFSVKYKHPPKDYKNGYMFKLGVADKSGETEIVYFGGIDKEKVESVYKEVDEGDMVFVKGRVNERNKRINIVINEDSGEIRKASEKEYDIKDFLNYTNQDIDKMFDYCVSKISGVKDENIKKLLELIFINKEFSEKFRKSPAAMYIHHNCIGGLLEHTWGMLKICETLKILHPSLDGDYLVAGALLHDIGKVREFQTTSNIKITEEGMLLSHVFLGAEFVLDAIKSIDKFPELIKNKILHIILSHHGELEYGALKKPQFPEAAAVSLADYMDSNITQHIRIKKDVSTEDFRTFSKNLGEIYLK